MEKSIEIKLISIFLMNNTYISSNNIVKKEYCDRNNHLNIAFYMMYYSDATFDFLNEIGLTEEYKSINILTAVVSKSFTIYKKELYYNDIFRIESNMIFCNHSHIVILHKIQKDNTLVNKCYMRLDFINTFNRSKIDIPSEIATNLHKFLLKGVKNIFTGLII
jgi:acyl-CoA thioesterase FadM